MSEEIKVSDGVKRGNRRGWLGVIIQYELVSQQLVAMDFVDCVLRKPALAGKLARYTGLAGGHRLGDHLAEVEIAADTLRIGTIQAEDGLGVLRIDSVSDRMVASQPLRREMAEFYGEGLQLGILRLQTGGFLAALVLEAAVIRSRC